MELRPIPGHNSDYLAGDDGNIYSLKSGSPVKLKSSFDGSGKYLKVWAYPDNRLRVSRSVHTLILLAFHGQKPDPKATASHLNGDGADNRPSNLTWEDHADNLARKNDHGTHDRGFNNTRSCITPDLLSEIRSLLDKGEMTQQQIADRVGISRTMVSRIKTGKKYKDF